MSYRTYEDRKNYRVIFSDGTEEIVEDATYEDAMEVVEWKLYESKDTPDWEIEEIEDEDEDEYEDEDD